MFEFILFTIFLGVVVYFINTYSSYHIECHEKNNVMDELVKQEVHTLLAQNKIEQQAAETQRKMLEEAERQNKLFKS